MANIPAHDGCNLFRLINFLLVHKLTVCMCVFVST